MILNKNFSIWLIGPSAAGKTTISKLLYENLRRENNLILVDGDKIRNLYENNLGYDTTKLVVKKAFADQGPVMKRFRPRAQGRAYRILKPTSHITIVVGS